jgi:hypothetical protein
MDTKADIDRELLIGEVERYLDVVASFRNEGCAPVYSDDEPLARLVSPIAGDAWTLIHA